MTKQTKTLTVLAAALVVCGGAYAALRVWNDQQAQVDDTVYVTQLSDLTALSLTNGQGELSFTKAEDVWQYDGDDAFPADQEAVEDLAEQIGSLAAIRVIDDPEDLSAYGLDEPALQASVTAGDGTAVTLLLGDVSDSYCYAKRTDSDTVYTVSTDLPENLESLELLDLAAIPDFPDLGTDTISSLTWESGGTALTLTKTETETAGTESGDSSSSESAEETEPAWDVNGTAIPSDNSAFTSLMAQLSSLAFDACYDYKGEADTLAACGLDTPVGVLTVTYGEGETLTLTIGALDGTGDSYYAQLSGDPGVYLLSADSVDTLISLSAQELTAAEDDEAEDETASDTSSDSSSSSLLICKGSRPQDGSLRLSLQKAGLKLEGKNFLLRCTKTGT